MANSVVFGIFSTKTQVETAVDEMKREGFRNADISVLFPHNEGTKDFAVEKGTKDVAEGAAAGATSGAVHWRGASMALGIGIAGRSGVGAVYSPQGVRLWLCSAAWAWALQSAA